MITQEKQIRGHHPNFLLLCDAQASGRWQFSLEPLDGGNAIEVADCEPSLRGERLELLTVIRGLEALDQPSRVTLVTTSRYVARGIRFGMDAWRRGDWQWERFGELVPIKNHDLWARLDGVLAVHDVRCKHYRLDGSHVPLTISQTTSGNGMESANGSLTPNGRSNRRGASGINPPHFAAQKRLRGDAPPATSPTSPEMERNSSCPPDTIARLPETTASRQHPHLLTRNSPHQTTMSRPQRAKPPGFIRVLPSLVRELIGTSHRLARSV